MAPGYDILVKTGYIHGFSVVIYRKKSIPMMQADMTMIPQTWVELTDEDDIKKLNRTLDLLDEDDDVQAVYHNWDE